MCFVIFCNFNFILVIIFILLHLFKETMVKRHFMLYNYYSFLFYRYVLCWSDFFFVNIFLFLFLPRSFFLIYNKLNVFCYINSNSHLSNFFGTATNAKGNLYNIVIKNRQRFLFMKKFFLVGLGCESFVYKNDFYLNLGYSHYLKLKVLPGLLVYCRKKRFYVFSSNKKQFVGFLDMIFRSYRFNVYKIKGLVYFKSIRFIKNIVCMKQGKKKYR